MPVSVCRRSWNKSLLWRAELQCNSMCLYKCSFQSYLGHSETKISFNVFELFLEFQVPCLAHHLMQI